MKILLMRIQFLDHLDEDSYLYQENPISYIHYRQLKKTHSELRNLYNIKKYKKAIVQVPYKSTDTYSQNNAYIDHCFCIGATGTQIS